MVKSILDGMIAAIRTKYDDTYGIYTESTEQVLEGPCFSVSCQKITDEQKAISRHQRVSLFLVKYVPSSEEPVAECMAVMEELYDLLSVISAGTVKLRGRELSGKREDGVLQFQVTYAFFLLESLTETDMEQLEAAINGKGKVR